MLRTAHSAGVRMAAPDSTPHAQVDCSGTEELELELELELERELELEPSSHATYIPCPYMQHIPLE